MTSIVSQTTSSTRSEDFAHGINRVTVSTCGRYWATSDVDMNVTVRLGQELLFETNFGSVQDKVKPTDRVRGMAFSPSGDVLYVAAADRVTAVFSSNGNEIWSYQAPRSFGFLIISPIALDVASNGDLVAAFDSGSFVVWDNAGSVKASFKDNDSPRWLRFAMDDSFVAGSDSFSICMWPLERSMKKRKLVLSDRVFAFEVWRGGSVAATRSLKEVSLWDLKAGVPLCSVPVGPGIPLLAFHPFEEQLVYGERNRLHLVDFQGRTIARYDLSVASALSAAFTVDGAELLVGCTDNRVIRIGVEQGV